MIAEVVKALKAYEALDTTGKALFRGETGLVRPQQAKGKAKRKYTRRAKPVAAAEEADPGPVPPKPKADPGPVGG
jgi:hypothetical protein